MRRTVENRAKVAKRKAVCATPPNSGKFAAVKPALTRLVLALALTAIALPATASVMVMGSGLAPDCSKAAFAGRGDFQHLLHVFAERYSKIFALVLFG